MDDWQLIKTAPRDGTFFIAYMGGPQSAGGFSLCHWWAPPDGREPGWFSERFASLEAWPGLEPTHYLPLPAPPK